jgi:hypothetical protein
MHSLLANPCSRAMKMVVGARRVAHRSRRPPLPPSLFRALLLALVVLSKQQGVVVVVLAQSNGQKQALCFQQPNSPGCQSCLLPSFSPGCNDPTCTERVCSSALSQTQCCTQSWGLECAAVAQIVCFPEIMPWYEKLENKQGDERKIENRPTNRSKMSRVVTPH